jgi:hypothetical protein
LIHKSYFVYLFKAALYKLLVELSKENCSIRIEEHVLDTYAGKQISQAATDVLLTLVLKKRSAFENKLELLTTRCL